ncbi:mitochondrial dynamin GTPase Msp1 [Mycoemilia scoparia]|uniref:Mitochondrial dynamin GTPase Msp1 n=1 Tax=Mycoemilia scoparia TaxID=417184 RepID=A0A9W8DV38_9FUNG|nr:mitochondrial dynamin GTPase Msp1 [Mycoemilia scoparia]
MQPQTKKLLIDVALMVASQAAVYFGIRYIISSMDPSNKEKRDMKEKSLAIIDKLRLKGLRLNEYEKVIMSEVILCEDIRVTFSQIGGLEHIIQELTESVIYPLNHPHLFTSASGLLGAPKGILLYGPPGCGKTMIAKALAKESGATFINLHLSTLMDKWFGESNRLVRAVFSLAEKLQPAIIFIDEIDSFLRSRQSGDHEVTGMMKAEFMSLWDGLTTGEDSRILVLGATNRPNDIDSAILRRMPKRFFIRPPGPKQRRQILDIMLKSARLEEGFDFDTLVKGTEGMSGSDLKELCRNAAMVPVREYMRKNPIHLNGTAINSGVSSSRNSTVVEEKIYQIEKKDVGTVNDKQPEEDDGSSSVTNNASDNNNNSSRSSTNHKQDSSKKTDSADTIRPLKLEDFISLADIEAELGTKLSYNDRINVTDPDFTAAEELEYEEAD